MRDIWVFLGLETVLFILSYLLVNNVNRLKQLFIQNGSAGAVRTAAIANFYRKGLYRTNRKPASSFTCQFSSTWYGCSAITG